ncbi:MAG: glycoside hydrolase family 3 N-terminal domain-containing protein [Parvibaculaceae bacterium]
MSIPRFVAILLLGVGLLAPRPLSAGTIITLAEQAGQMVITGFEGTRPSSPGFVEIRRDLEAGRIGGVLFLGHNIASPAEVREMTRILKACRCPLPPLIAVDEEGGWVERLGTREGFTYTPSAMRIAGRGLEEAARQYDRLAAEVAGAGFNLNLAPVVDLDEGRANPIIGRIARSFSDRPLVVHAFARVFIESHRKLGVLTSLKHFPGHGSSVSDPHFGPSDVTASWDEGELMPYWTLLEDGLVDTVMVGHLRNRHWKGVASLAPSDAVERLLRQQIGFDGVVLTDDLDMGAVEAASPKFDTRIERAVLAGSDILVVGNHPRHRRNVGETIQRAILSAVTAGRLDIARIAASYERIRKLKARLLLPPPD